MGLKQSWTKLRSSEVGSRFKDFYEYRQSKRETAVAKVIKIVLAIVFILFGLAVGWLPGPGGFVSFIGLGMLATEFRPLAVAMDWCEVRIVAVWRWFRSLPIILQVLWYVFLFGMTIGMFVLMWKYF